MGKVSYYTDPAEKLFFQKSNFVGGINQATADDLVPENSEKNILNLDLTYAGALKKRAGFISHTNLTSLEKLNQNIDISGYPTIQSPTSVNALAKGNIVQGVFTWHDNVTNKDYIVMLYHNQVYIKLSTLSEIKGSIDDYEDWVNLPVQKYDEKTLTFSDFLKDTSYSKEYIFFAETEDQDPIRIDVPLFSKVYDDEGNRKTIIGREAWEAFLANDLAKTYKVDGVSYGGKFYLATGHKLLVIENFEGEIVARQVEPVVPTAPEFNTIGGNTLLDEPDVAIKSKVGIVLAVNGLIITSEYEGKKLKKGLVNHKVNIRAITTRTEESSELYYRFKYKKQGETDWTNKYAEQEGWEKITVDANTDIVWEALFNQATLYQISLEVTPADNMDTENWQVKNAGEIESYVHTGYEVVETPEFFVNANFSIHTCRRLLVFYDQLLAYADTADGNVLYISDVRRFNYFPAYYTTIIDTPAKDEITSINYYQNVLVVFTENNIFMLKGKNPYDFAVDNVNRTIGCAYGWTARVVGNYLYFMSKEGLFKLKSLYYTEDRLNVEQIDYRVNPLFNPNADDYIAYTYKGNYHLVELQPYESTDVGQSTVFSNDMEINPNVVFGSIPNGFGDIVEKTNIDEYNENLIASLVNCENDLGVFRQTEGDTDTDVKWTIKAYQDDTFVRELATINNNVEGSVVALQFVKEADFNKLSVGIEGKNLETAVIIDASEFIDKQTYRVRLHINKVLIEGTGSVEVEVTTNGLIREDTEKYTLETEWERTGNIVVCKHTLICKNGITVSGSYTNNYRGYHLKTEWTRDNNTVTCTHKLICDVAYDLDISGRANNCTVGGDSKTFNSPTIYTSGNTTITLGRTTHTVSGNTVNASTTFYMRAYITGVYVDNIKATGTIADPVIAQTINECTVGEDRQEFTTEELHIRNGQTYTLGTTTHSVEGTNIDVNTIFNMNALNVEKLTNTGVIATDGFEVRNDDVVKVDFNFLDIVNIQKQYTVIKKTLNFSLGGHEYEFWSYDDENKVFTLFEGADDADFTGMTNDMINILSTYFTAVSYNEFWTNPQNYTICVDIESKNIYLRYYELKDATELRAWLASKQGSPTGALTVRIIQSYIPPEKLNNADSEALSNVLLHKGVENHLISNKPMQVTYINTEDQEVTTEFAKEIVIKDAKTELVQAFKFLGNTEIEQREGTNFLNVFNLNPIGTRQDISNLTLLYGKVDNSNVVYDGTITITGTTTNVEIPIYSKDKPLRLSAGLYIMGGENKQYKAGALRVRYTDTLGNVQIFKANDLFLLIEDTDVEVYLQFEEEGIYLDHAEYRPQINAGSELLPYEAYGLPIRPDCVASYTWQPSEITLEVSYTGLVITNEIVSENGKIFIYDPYLEAWTSYVSNHLNINNILVLGDNIVATDRNSLKYMVFPYLKLLNEEIICYNDGEHYYKKDGALVKVEDGTNYITKVEEVYNSFGKPYHTKKFKQLMLKAIDSKEGFTKLRVTVLVDGATIVDPITYIVDVDPDTQSVYVRTEVEDMLLPTISELGNGFVLDKSLLGDYDISLHKLKFSGKGKTIKCIIEQIDDKFFGLLGYSVIYKEKKPSVKNNK